MIVREIRSMIIFHDFFPLSFFLQFCYYLSIVFLIFAILFVGLTSAGKRKVYGGLTVQMFS